MSEQVYGMVPQAVKRQLLRIIDAAGSSQNKVVGLAVEEWVRYPHHREQMLEEIEAQAERISELERRLRQLEGWPCPMCDGSGVMFPLLVEAD